jgi:hypothetical protein
MLGGQLAPRRSSFFFPFLVQKKSTHGKCCSVALPEWQIDWQQDKEINIAVHKLTLVSCAIKHIPQKYTAGNMILMLSKRLLQ